MGLNELPQRLAGVQVRVMLMVLQVPSFQTKDLNIIIYEHKAYIIYMSSYQWKYYEK